MDDALEHIILVDEADREIGTAKKLEAHLEGRLHRALSVIVKDSAGRILLQKRASGKYHSGGLWTNTCCSHPRPGEPIAIAARRRLAEEMGIECPLLPLMATIYRAELDHGMIEHEYVHVFAGIHDGAIRPDPAEADGFAWVTPEWLRADMASRPETYSVWFGKYVAEFWPKVSGDAVWTRLERAASAA